ncbi:uncharacterized protein [Asterias amurensis]|uniref:uncharacterized protein isoform X1 n=2 Tax=Asterias amurensis TaxID=7602 RepID=UPI003AB2A4EB
MAKFRREHMLVLSALIAVVQGQTTSTLNETNYENSTFRYTPDGMNNTNETMGTTTGQPTSVLVTESFTTPNSTIAYGTSEMNSTNEPPATYETYTIEDIDVDNTTTEVVTTDLPNTTLVTYNMTTETATGRTTTDLPVTALTTMVGTTVDHATTRATTDTTMLATSEESTVDKAITSILITDEPTTMLVTNEMTTIEDTTVDSATTDQPTTILATNEVTKTEDTTVDISTTDQPTTIMATTLMTTTDQPNTTVTTYEMTSTEETTVDSATPKMTETGEPATMLATNGMNTVTDTTGDSFTTDQPKPLSTTIKQNTTLTTYDMRTMENTTFDIATSGDPTTIMTTPDMTTVEYTSGDSATTYSQPTTIMSATDEMTTTEETTVDHGTTDQPITTPTSITTIEAVDQCSTGAYCFNNGNCTDGVCDCPYGIIGQRCEYDYFGWCSGLPTETRRDIYDGRNHTIVTWADPIAAGGNPSCTVDFQCYPQSGSRFPIGRSTVRCTALGESICSCNDSCEFDVSVTAWCPDDIYILMSGGFVTFEATQPSSSQNSVEECTVTDDPSTMTPRASRECSGSAETGAFWSDPVFVECYEKPSVNDYLDNLSEQQVTEDNVAEVSLALMALTNKTSSIDSKGISSTASVLDNIISIGSPSPQVTTDVINVVNNVLQVSEESLLQSDNSTSRIVKAVEKQVFLVVSNGSNFSAVASSLAVKALNVPLTENFRGIVFSTRQNEDGNENLEEDDVNVCTKCEETGGDGKTIDTSISLPGDIFSLVNKTGKVPISFTVYQNAKLFGSGRSSSSSTPTVGSRIVSASINGATVENLPPNASVVTSFLLLSQVRQSDVARTSRESINGVADVTNIHCVFWDFKLNNGIGDWSKEGCQLVSLSSRRTECKCNHLTSFAVLVDIHGQKQSSVALDIISKIGCGVSIIALLLTLVVYLAIRSLRGKLPGRILICLSLSLLCLYTIFLIGIEQTATRAGCILVAVLIHYFTLASLAWMAVEATNLYMFLVKVVNLGLRHFLVKASLLAWGTPLLIVTIILAVDYTQYENQQFCFLRPGGWAFLYAEIVVLALVLLYNTIIFILVLWNLYFRQRIKSTLAKNQKGKAVKRIQNSVAISVLLGLTWVFGLLSIFESSNFVFQVLFSVFNSLQGLLIFLMFCCRQQMRVTIMNMLPVRNRKVFCPRIPDEEGESATKSTNFKSQSDVQLTSLRQRGSGGSLDNSYTNAVHEV